MTAKTMTLWSCDRCGTMQDLDDSIKQPNGWVGIYTASPPTAATGDRRDLCQTCVRDLDRFLIKRRRPEVAA